MKDKFRHHSETFPSVNVIIYERTFLAGLILKLVRKTSREHVCGYTPVAVKHVSSDEEGEYH